MQLKLFVIPLVMLALGMSATARAQTPKCDALTGKQKTLADELLASQHPHACCDGTIAECLKAKNPCSLARRLADNICHHVAAGEDRERIIRRLQTRARSLSSREPVRSIDISGLEIAGDSNAPITVVVYACARCPFCARLVTHLHRAVNGPLKGKVRLVFKPFPLKSHAHAKEGALAMLAALEQGKMWSYILKLYADYDAFSVDKLEAQAAALGMDAQRFKQAMNDPSVINRLVAFKKEGLANGVEATPTIFINGRRWSGFLDLVDITDAIEELSEGSSK
jgi:protein-disulfide isomerase